jgi:hypothetical protein
MFSYDAGFSAASGLSIGWRIPEAVTVRSQPVSSTMTDRGI